MSDEDKKVEPAPVDQEQASKETPSTPPQPAQHAAPAIPYSDRTELLARARAFLISPQVHLQDSDAKRSFLEEKGLTPSEITQLLRELPPPVPPRTYPAPPPSNLPNLLIGVARIFTWLTGSSAIVLFIYYRYLLPRITQSYQARLALRKHQSALITRLTGSAAALKETQSESFKDLPRTVPVYEDSQYADCHTIDDLLSRVKNSGEESSRSGEEMPDVTILRCALEERAHANKEDTGPSTEELFRHLESKLPWLAGEEGATRQGDLWSQLNSCPLFVSSVPQSGASSSLPPDHPSRLLWRYVPPPPQSTPPLLTALANLQASLPRSSKATNTGSGGASSIPALSATQRTLQVLSDFTGYITTQTYSLGITTIRSINGIPSGNPLEDELRREIRALKGLVLNRRSFLPSATGVLASNSDPPRLSDA